MFGRGPGARLISNPVYQHENPYDFNTISQESLLAHLARTSLMTIKGNVGGGTDRPARPDESDLITLDATLLLAMETAKDRAFILDIEALLTNFIQSPQMERTELEPINSYYRLLVHRVARYYGVEHTIEPARPAILILSKTLESKIPLVRLFELIDRPPPHQFVRPEAVVLPVSNSSAQQQQPVRIMKRDALKTDPKPAVPVSETTKTGNEELQAARSRILVEDAEKKKASAEDVKASVEWKVDAPEFDPFNLPPSTMSPKNQPRPIFTKPIVNFDAVHLPQHIILIRTTPSPSSGSAAMQPLLDVLNRSLGATWEIRTKPMHQDALLICFSPVHADKVLNEGQFKLPGFMIIPWKPCFYAES